MKYELKESGTGEGEGQSFISHHPFGSVRSSSGFQDSDRRIDG